MEKQATAHINTTWCQLNNYDLVQVDYEDRYRDAEEIQNLPKHLHVEGMGIAISEWLEDDSSILNSWQVTFWLDSLVHSI